MSFTNLSFFLGLVGVGETRERPRGRTRGSGHSNARSLNSECHRIPTVANFGSQTAREHV